MMTRTLLLFLVMMSVTAFADGGRKVTAGLCRPTAKFEKMYGDLSKLETWDIDGKPLHHWERRFTIHAPIDKVFEAYLIYHPAQVWPREFVDFQFAYAPGSHEKIGPSDPWPRAELGTKMFVDLKAHPGEACRMMVAVVVARLEAPRLLRYDYLEGSTNGGINQIELEPGVDADGRTVTFVHHVTDYWNPSLALALAMPFMYERNHGGVISGLHNGIKRIVEADETLNARP